MLIIVQIIMGIAFGIGSPSFANLVSENLDNKKHLAEWGDLMLIQNIAIGVGSAIAGFTLVKFGFTTVFALMAILEFTAFFVFHYATQKHTS